MSDLLILAALVFMFAMGYLVGRFHNIRSWFDYHFDPDPLGIPEEPGTPALESRLSLVPPQDRAA